MSSGGVHEGVKLQTPLCPQLRASKGISSFIDRAAECVVAAAGGPQHPPLALIAFVSRSPPIYCCTFFNFSGLVV